jgi:hypothetical protein
VSSPIRSCTRRSISARVPRTSSLGILALLFVKAFVTETKGRSLEEIEADLQGSAGGTIRPEEARREAAASL